MAQPLLFCGAQVTLRAALRVGLRRLGYEVHRVDRPTTAGAIIGLLAQHFGVQHAIDVGANEGQFVRLLRSEAKFEGRIDSFEPSLTTFKRLSGRLQNDARWHGHQLAATATAGEAILNTYPSSLFNSLSTTTSLGEEVFGRIHASEFRPTGKETVQALPLDEVDLPEMGSTLLKIDTQGHDWGVIAGADQLLKRVDIIVIELSFESYYESSIPAWESIRRLAELDFGLVGVQEICKANDGVTLGEADGIFARRQV